jgi:hypothetical protein
LAVPFVARAQDIHDPIVSVPSPVDRGLLSSEIVGRWRDEASRQGLDLQAWEADMNRALATQSDGRLQAVRAAATWAEASRLLGARPALFATNRLGDEATDLVYFPLAPCRILDTRYGTGNYAGRLAAGSTTSVAHNFNLVGQGGNNAGCGVPVDPAAIVATVTVVSPTGAGNLRMYAMGTMVPNASAINYTSVPGLALANTTVIPTGQLLGDDFYIQVDTSSTHVVIDVVGYFWKPSAMPTAGQAFAHVYSGLMAARTKGFTSYTNPATGTYCLVPSFAVDLTIAPVLVSVDYSGSSPTTVAHWRNSGIGCASGELAVYLWNTSTGAAANGAFTVFVP